MKKQTKKNNVKISLPLKLAQEIDSLIIDSLLRYDEAGDTDTRGYKLQKQIQGRLNAALKRYWQKEAAE